MKNSSYPADLVLINPDGYDDKSRKFDVFFDRTNNAMINVLRGWSLREIKEPTDAKD